jgi:DNA-directed RNA polymerase specialized sigma subunit
MRRWWDELVIDFFDRMDGFVAVAHKGRLNDDEHELAVQNSMMRFSEKLIDTYEGASMGELVNACKQLAAYICMDVQRASIRSRGSATESLDEGWNLDGEDRGAPSWVAGEAWQRLDREHRAADARAFIDWALPRIADERRRRVLEMTIEGVTVEDICGELGVSSANAYQLRTRALRDLKKLKEQYDA